MEGTAALAASVTAAVDFFIGAECASEPQAWIAQFTKIHVAWRDNDGTSFWGASCGPAIGCRTGLQAQCVGLLALGQPIPHGFFDKVAGTGPPSRGPAQICVAATCFAEFQGLGSLVHQMRLAEAGLAHPATPAAQPSQQMQPRQSCDLAI
jgi:hypothetical protein